MEQEEEEDESKSRQWGVFGRDFLFFLLKPNEQSRQWGVFGRDLLVFFFAKTKRKTRGFLSFLMFFWALGKNATCLFPQEERSSDHQVC